MATRALLDALVHTYGGSDVRLTPFYEEPDQAVYRADRSNGPPWVVRHFSATRPYADVEGDAEMLLLARHLLIEQIVRTRTGDGATPVDGRGVIVTKLEEGPSPRRRSRSCARSARPSALCIS